MATTLSNWPERTIAPPLPETEVHVWCVGLARPSADVTAISTLLSPDEQVRASKFHFEDDRQHYVYGRAVLRVLIGQYEQIAPTAVQFSYGAHGKPMLADSDLRFNLSHAAGVALMGANRGWLQG